MRILKYDIAKSTSWNRFLQIPTFRHRPRRTAAHRPHTPRMHYYYTMTMTLTMMLSATSSMLRRGLHPLSRTKGVTLSHQSGDAIRSNIICRSMSDKASSTTSAVRFGSDDDDDDVFPTFQNTNSLTHIIPPRRFLF